MQRAVLWLVMVALLWFGGAGVSYAKWFVLQDKNGVCSVRELKAKSPTTIAGPFDTKSAAEKERGKLCPRKRK